MLALSDAQREALSQRVISLAYFVHLDLSGGAVRVWNGVGSLVTGGNTWQGVGELGVIRGIESDRSLRATGISLALLGVPGASISGGAIASTRALRYQARPINVYLGVMSPDTGALIDDLVTLWSGIIDTMQFRIGETISVALAAERADTYMRRTNGLRMTTASHNKRLALSPNTDLFFEPASATAGQAQGAV